MKAGHTVVMPNTPQSSSRVTDCCLLWIYYLDDTDKEISRTVNMCLQGSCTLTLLTRAEPKTKAQSQHTIWSAAAAAMCRAGCDQMQDSAVRSACQFKLTCSTLEQWRCTCTAHRHLSWERQLPRWAGSVTDGRQSISRQFKQDQDGHKSQTLHALCSKNVACHQVMQVET